MFLATTDLKEFWDVSDELALLGPWCVRFDDPRWLEGLRVRRAPNAWDDREALAAAGRRTLELQPRLIAGLAAFLNKAHGLQLSERYWRILLGPWAMFLTHHLLDRLAQVKTALTAFPRARSLSLDRQDYYTPRSEGDFMSFSLTSRYDLQLYSDILRLLGQEAPARRLGRLNPYAQVQTAGPRGLKGRAKRALAAASSRLIGQATPAIVTDELYPASRLVWTYAWRMRAQALPLLRQPAVHGPPPSAERRRGIESLFDGDEFWRLFSSCLPWTLPTLYLEGFREAREAGLARRSRAPEAVFASTSVYFDDAFKLAAAEWTERGAKLWTTQHGGVYGMSRIIAGEWHEQGISDAYFTWGWSSQSRSEKLRDIPVPHLSRLARRWRRGRQGGDRVVYAMMEHFRNSNSITSCPMGWQWERAFDWRERFLEALGPLRERALARLRPYAYGWGSAGRLRRRFPGLAIDDLSGSFYGRLETCRLVVIDHPSTSVIESLALNVPTILFWDPNLWELRPEVQPLFDALRQVGVLHEDPSAAAAQVQRVYAQPESWWGTLPVQEARRAVADRLARISEDWPADWERITRRELAGARP